MSNRLADATSPYLLQHAENPVDWWPWTPAAFEQARERNVPVLLSVGYAACHWCHVMAHESFEDQHVADAINAGFVAIKVDREERPDVDAVYMQATTAMTGHGGWPMTCLLTPQGEPFWCGTYLPKPQFVHLLASAKQTWVEREAEVRAGGAHIVESLSRAQHQAESATEITSDVLARSVAVLSADFDATHGGFGGAPKFPPSMVLSFLLRHSTRTGDEQAGQMARQTARAMARSGMYDQVGGGFARYAVDAAWVVPHFEKMLYDNALLLRVYTDVARASPGADAAEMADRDVAERVVRQSIGWLLREMWTEQAGFASSLDADTEGVEGATYVWTPAQLAQVLGASDGERAAEVFCVTTGGTFEHGTSTLQLPTDPQDQQWYADVVERLDLHRSLRPQPGRDDKVVTAWNGALIAALAEAGWFFEEPDWIDLAARCADLLLNLHIVDGRLRRSSRDGMVGEAAGVAEDYGGLAEGLLALHAATAQPRWLHAAGQLLDTAVAVFRIDGTDDVAQLRFSDSARDVSDLVLQPRSRGDNAEPCGQSALAGALLRYGALAGSAQHLQAGRAALAPMGSIAAGAPRFAGWALAAAEDAVSGPAILAIASADGSLTAAARRAPPGMVVVVGPESSSRDSADTIAPVLQQRPPLQGRDTAYLCRGMTCQVPTNDPGVLGAAMRTG